MYDDDDDDDDGGVSVFDCEKKNCWSVLCYADSKSP